jgi:steroid 5-alpha reductase family enzyme
VPAGGIRAHRRRVEHRMIIAYLLVAAGISLAMAFAWFVQWRSRNASWVDAIWTFASGFGGAAYALLSAPAGAPPWRHYVIAALSAAWALRLGGYIVTRAATGHEDPRYTALRRQWGNGYQGRMFAFLQLQALIACVLAVSVGLGAANPVRGLRELDIVGVIILVLAVGGEGLADRQLQRFRANPENRGRICDTGLWAWSRHPNYFFEWLVWIGFVLFALNFAGQHPWGWAAMGAPIMMYWLLVYVSGVAPVEQAMEKSRGAAFARYAARVSKFFPWPPKDAA